MADAFCTYPYRHVAWDERVDSPRLATGSRARVAAVLRAARTYRCLVLNGFDKADMAAAALLARMPRPPKVIILDPTWKPGDSTADRVFTRTAVRLLDGPHVHYGVLSAYEADSFPRTWRVDAARVHVVPWFTTLSEQELAAERTVGGGVFASGNSLRDWDLLLDAAPAVASSIRITSTTLTDAQLRRLPGNVTAGPVSQGEHDALLRAADVVVVPMQVRPDRSSGQGTMLAAMALGKPLVVNDAPGVRDYVDHDVTGVIVPMGSPQDLAQAISDLMADPARRARIGAAAEQAVKSRFLVEHYFERVLALVDEVIGEAPVPRRT